LSLVTAPKDLNNGYGYIITYQIEIELISVFNPFWPIFFVRFNAV